MVETAAENSYPMRDSRLMKTLPIIVFAAFTLSVNAQTEAQQPPPPQPTAPAGTASAVNTLSDAECIAVASYMQRLKRAAMENWVQGWLEESNSLELTLNELPKLPAEGVPDDFRRYVEEYCALVLASNAKRNELSGSMVNIKVDDAWDISRQIGEVDKKLREDKLALVARYSRASLLGSGWETRVYNRAKFELLLGEGSAKAYQEANPLKENEKADSSRNIAGYLQHLLAQPQPELTAESARRLLEQRETLRLLDPTWRLEETKEFFGVRKGTRYVVRLPQDAGTGCTWQLADPLTEDSLVSVEWETVPTTSLKKNWPHGKGVQLANPLPSTPETRVASVLTKKAGTAVLRFNCVREGSGEIVASKVLIFYVRHANDYRPLMETDPIPEPEPTPLFEPGVASLSDEECLALQRYLQMVYCYTAEECAKAVENQEHLQVPGINAGALPTLLFQAPKLPQDFHDYLVEHHNLFIGIRATSRSLDRKEYNYRYGKGITKEQRRELREERKQLQQRKDAMWKTLREKYPRAIILRNAGALSVIDQIYESYNTTDADARRFFAQHPEMRDAITKLSKSTYFRFLAEERNKEEISVAAARRLLERLDALRVMGAVLNGEGRHHFYGLAGESSNAIILPLAPETGFGWKLEGELSEDSPVQVEWHQMESEKLRKLKDLGLISDDLPESPQLSIATLRMVKKGSAKLRFICTRPGDEEPLLATRAEGEVRTMDEDEEERPLDPSPGLPGAQPEATVAQLSDAECLALLRYIRQAKAVSALAVADAIEMEEDMGNADLARLAAAELTDDIPADMRDFIHAYSALLHSTEQKLQTLNHQIRELRKESGEEEDEEQLKPLRRQYRHVCRQHEQDAEALKAACPRAGFLCEYLSTDAVEEVMQELAEESERAQAFLAAHPKLKLGKRATAIAWLRHVAGEKLSEPTAAEARDTIRKLDLVNRLRFAPHTVSQRRLPTGETIPNLLPHDAASGYSWQLSTPLPDDAPLKLEWHTLPTAELEQLQDRGVVDSYRDIPGAPDTTIATLRTEKAGKMTLEFHYSKPGEAKPLLKRKIIIEIREQEED